MYSPGNIKRAAPACVALPMLLASSLAMGQAEQVLSEVGAMGQISSTSHGVVRPDFSEGGYADWVAFAGGRNFTSFAISPIGTALVLDGTVIREFRISGVENTNRGFPVDCTSLSYTTTKPNGQSGTDSLSSCSAFTPLNDGTLRIAGQAKGKAFVIIEYDPTDCVSVGCVGDVKLQASGTPPSISDMDGDEYADADTRKETGYWAIGDRKKIIFFPLDPDDPNSEQNFQVVATINGVTLDGITPFGSNRVIAALTTGELRQVTAKTGAVSTFKSMPTAADCGLGNKDPQKYSVRGDPSGILFVGNRGCHTISVFDTNGNLISDPGLTSNPFELAGPDVDITGLDWQSGQGGDFEECQGATESAGCSFGAQTEQAVMWEVKNIPGTDTLFRMFQFVDLDDCRWSGNRPCPIVNCPLADLKPGGCPVPNKEDQVLDLAQVLIRADQTGAFERLAFGEGAVPVMAIPSYMRGEECYPSVNNSSDCVDNHYRFHSFFAVTDAIFKGTFFTDYKIDAFRDDSLDPCVIPDPNSTIDAINETANLIVYNSDTFDTVSTAEGGRGGVIINDGCNGRAGGYKWSSQTVGLELYDDSSESYIHQAERMMQELIVAGDELLCSPFGNPAGGPDLGPLLGSTDCSRIAGELAQMEEKLATCLSSLYVPKSGNNSENCNAFFTKVQNLQNVTDASAWPDLNLAANLDLLRPNYEGEFRARLATLIFFIESYVFNAEPPQAP